MPNRGKAGFDERSARKDDEASTQSAVLEGRDSQRSALRVAEDERDEYRALLQRTQAEFENYQKRIQREFAEERRFAHAPLVRELLPVLDNLQRALATAKTQAKDSALIQGVALVHSQLLELLNRFGVVPIESLGQPFDPNLHEAVLTRSVEGAAPGDVVEILETGYRLHDRLLRPAKVVVAGGSSPS
jgi:molecular chaperone GrpE